MKHHWLLIRAEKEHLHEFQPPEFDLENAHYIILSPAKGVGRWS
jgi:hypothetical protein